MSQAKNQTDELSRLSTTQRAAVEKAIKAAKSESGIHTVKASDGEAYAYSSSSSRGDRVHWGFNGGANGYCIARGVR